MGTRDGHFTLTPKQEDQLERVGQSHNLRFMILHGSYAKRAAGKGSDLDIALLGQESIGFDELLRIQGTLAEVFGDNPDRELDVKSLHGADPLFRHHVVKDGVLLYGNSSDYEEFKLYAFRDYMDSKDLRDLEETLLRKSIQKLADRDVRS